MLNESAPPDKLIQTMALYGDEDIAAGGVVDLGDPVLRTGDAIYHAWWTSFGEQRELL